MLQTGQIEAKYQVSRDTLRFYIEEGLVVPDKVAGKYQWLPEHEAALINILELRALGLSVKAIKRIKELHETACGTEIQWRENLAGVEEELADLDRQQADLDRRRASLGALAEQLRQRLEV